MKSNPLISIIIPVYNLEKYIEECVKSILNQKFDDCEIILVDDGSPDNCGKICDRLSSENPCIKVIHKENGGVSSARRAGAETAQGDYIFCVDGDDFLKEGCLLSVAEIINKTKADIICHGLVYERNDGFFESTLPHREGLYSKADIEKEIFPLLIHKCDATYFITSLCGKAIRRELFLQNILTDPRAVLGEDGACVIPCVYHAESMYIIKECFYYYRLNTESATKAKKALPTEWPEIVYNHIICKINVETSDFQSQLYRKLAHDIFTVCVTQFYSGTYKSAKKRIQEIISNPLYKEAIKNCKFKGSLKALVMQYALRYRLYCLIYFYSKL